MTKEDCRANALKCYRIAQKVVDRDVRRTLLDLAVQWHELAAQIARLQWNGAAEPSFPGARHCIETKSDAAETDKGFRS